MKGLLDLLDLLALPVREASLGQLDLWDLLGDRDLRDPLDLLERRAFLGRKVLLAELGGTGCRVLWVCRALLDPREFLERMETRVKLENLVRRVPKEGRESMVLLVHQVQWAPLVSLVLLALMERLVPGDSRDILELKAMKVPEVSQELQDPSGCRGCLVHQARRERRETLDLWVPPVHQDHVAQPDLMVLMVLKDLLVV